MFEAHIMRSPEQCSAAGLTRHKLMACRDHSCRIFPSAAASSGAHAACVTKPREVYALVALLAIVPTQVENAQNCLTCAQRALELHSTEQHSSLHCSARLDGA